MAGALLLIVVARAEHRRRFNHCFSDSDYRLVYTFDGEDAFDRFVEVRPDLVIAHEHAPRLDGTLLCQLLRQRGGAQLPFVLLTDEPISAGRLEATGIDASITWPFEPNELLPLIAGLLAGRSASPESSPSASPSQEGERTSTLDLDGSTLSAMLLDDDAEPGNLVEGDSDDIPTNPGEVPLLAGDLLEEPIAPVGLREDLPDEVTSVQVNAELFGLFEDPETTERGEEDDPAEVPLVSPVLDEGQDETSRTSEPLRAAPPELSSTTTDTAKKRALLEEPPLPGPEDLGQFTPGADTEDVERPHSDSMIREIPKEHTPTGERSSAPPARGDGRVGRGLDESQLGRRLTRRVQQLHKLLAELDHYQLLGLEPDATRGAIDDAHFDLSIEFHPDRFFLLRSGELKQQIFDIFHRLTEAYETLSNPESRALYDRRRSTSPAAPPNPLSLAPEVPSPSVETDTVEMSAGEDLFASPVYSSLATAQTFIDLARSAFEDADRNGARLYLSLAATQDPGNQALLALLDSLVARGAGLRPIPPIP